MTTNPPITKYRQYTKSNIESFKRKIDETDFTGVLQCNDAQKAFTMYHKQYLNVYEAWFPIKTVKSNYRTRKPWLTTAIKNSIRHKNTLYKKSLKRPSLQNISCYKEYKSLLNMLIKRCEKAYYEEQFRMNTNNLKRSWALIKNIIYKHRNKNVSTRFKFDGEAVSDKKRIAEEFNKFYVNVGLSLANKLPNSDVCPTSFIRESNMHSMGITAVTTEELFQIFRNLKDSSTGCDDIAACIVKSTFECNIDILLHIFNLSILNGIFPDELKLAKVIPLFKSGDTMLTNNYRPVSILPLFSKVLEKLMYDRLLSFVKKYQLLYKYQFGFREYHGTDIALTVLTDKIMSAFDEGDIVLGVFLDLSKAFDTVNHEILLMKLHKYGIRGLAYKWFSTYLSNRQQYVSFNGNDSQPQVIKCGVPQGSILGPLLFLLYVNDIANASSVLFMILFADDTNVFVQGKNINKMFNTMNGELQKLAEWMCINKLSLSVKKTEYIIFSLKRISVSEKQIVLNGIPIERVKMFKFLGGLIDEHLTWDQHVLFIKKKLLKGWEFFIKQNVFWMPPRYWHFAIHSLTLIWFIVLKYGEALVRKICSHCLPYRSELFA